MDMTSKCAMAAKQIRFISTHDDAPTETMISALDALSALIAEEKAASIARRKAAADAVTAAVADALKQ